MALAQEDVDFIKAHLAEWLQEAAPRPVFERELLERVTKVEEALLHQRDLMQQGFARVDARFEDMNKRFEQVDKRFEDMNKRFEQVDKRFEDMNKRFEQVDKRFEQMDKRFEQMDKRFEAVDRRFDEFYTSFRELNRRIDRFMFWSFGLTLTVGGMVIVILRLWPPGP